MPTQPQKAPLQSQLQLPTLQHGPSIFGQPEAGGSNQGQTRHARNLKGFCSILCCSKRRRRPRLFASVTCARYPLFSITLPKAHARLTCFVMCLILASRPWSRQVLMKGYISVFWCQNCCDSSSGHGSTCWAQRHGKVVVGQSPRDTRTIRETNSVGAWLSGSQRNYLPAIKRRSHMALVMHSRMAGVHRPSHCEHLNTCTCCLKSVPYMTSTHLLMVGINTYSLILLACATCNKLTVNSTRNIYHADSFCYSNVHRDLLARIIAMQCYDALDRLLGKLLHSTCTCLLFELATTR